MKTYKASFIGALFVSAFLLFSTGAALAEEGAVRLSNNAFKQVITKKADGSIEYDYVEPGLAIPGDVILYEIVFENISDKEVSNVVIDIPIANNTTYREDSVTGDNTEISFSVDGKKFSSPDTLKVKDKSGKTWKAKPKDYTAIRWVYKKALKPGEKGKVTYKATINKPVAQQ